MLLPTPNEIRSALPLSNVHANRVICTREKIAKILKREDHRLLIIAGPCSIHNTDDGLAYAEKLAQLAQDVRDQCLVVMRAYVEKPRTGCGWKGLVYDPHLNGTSDLPKGIHVARQFFLDLTDLGVPIGMEFLTPELAPYFSDLVSWGCIGARTSSSQLHRILASHLSFPFGIKNTVDGNTDVAIQGCCVARHAHTFPLINDDGRISLHHSTGNPHTHIVLRGGYAGPNFTHLHIQSVLDSLRHAELPPRVLVDCSHGNSERKYFKQREAFTDVLRQIQGGNHQIIGLMLESHLEAGSQTIPSQIADLQSGVSITDGCIDFSSTEELVHSIASSLSPSMGMTLTHS